MPPFYIVRLFRPRQYRGLESAVPQRPVVHVQHERELDEGHARHPVRLRLRPPPDEPLAAGTGRGAARRIRFRSGVTALIRTRSKRPWDSRADTPSFENGWNGLAGFLLGTPDGLGKEQPVHQDGQLGEPVRALHSRPLARHAEADARTSACDGSSIRTGGVRPGWASSRTTRTPTRRWSAGAAAFRRTTASATARSCLPRAWVLPTRWTTARSSEAATASPTTRIRGARRRCAAGIPLTIVAAFSGVNGYQPVTTESRLRRGGRAQPAARARLSAFRRSAARTSARAGFRCRLVAEMGYPVANQELHRGYIQSWNFIIERKLPGELVASVGYVGTASVNGFAFLDINASQIPGLRRRGPSAVRRSSGARRRRGSGTAARTATTTRCRPRINRRFADGLFLKGAYTYSQAIDMANYGDWTEFSWNAPSVFYRNRALGGEQHPAQLPARLSCTNCRSAHGKKWATTGVQQAILGGWQFNGAVRAYSGAAVHAERLRGRVEYAGQRADAGSGQGQRRKVRQSR